MLLWVLHAACARLHGLQSSYWVSQPHTPRHLTSPPEDFSRTGSSPKVRGTMELRRLRITNVTGHITRLGERLCALQLNSVHQCSRCGMLMTRPGYSVNRSMSALQSSHASDHAGLVRACQALVMLGIAATLSFQVFPHSFLGTCLDLDVESCCLAFRLYLEMAAYSSGQHAKTLLAEEAICSYKFTQSRRTLVK